MTWPAPIRLEYLSVWQAILLYLCLGVPVLWLGAKSMASIEPIRRWTAVGLRLDLLLLLVLLLAGARWVRPVKDLTVIAVRDVSRSIQNVPSNNPDGIQADISNFLKNQSHHKPVDDRIGAVNFDGSSWVDAIPGLNWSTGNAAIRTPTDGTNIGQAIQLALAVMPPDSMHRITLFSDGNATVGDLDQATRAAVSQHVPIDVVPLRFSIDHEISIEKLEAPSSQKEGTPFQLDIIMHSRNDGPVRARLSVTDNGTPLLMDRNTSAPFRDCVLQPGSNVEHVRLSAPPVGAHDFRASIEPLDDKSADTVTQNNQAQAMTLVLGKSRVLYIAGPHLDPTEPLRESLISQGIDVDEIDPATAPQSATELQQYSTVILNNVPKSVEGFGEPQTAALETFVKEMGGGLVVVGGPDSYGAGGWIGSKLEEMLPVSCEPPARQVMPAGALIIIIDRSGSMGETLGRSTNSKEEAANQAAILAMQALSPQDQIGVIAFDTEPIWVVPLGLNNHMQSTAAAINTISPGGGTEIYPALQEASAAISKLTPQDVPVRHILLLTDGYSQGGDFDKLISKMAATGVTLSTVGVGDDIDEKLLKGFATRGNGRFYRVADSRRLPQIFIKEALTLRSSLIREEPFTPRVRATASSLITGITATPDLQGMVRTWPKPSAMVQIPIRSDTVDPVLASWQVGLGKVVAFTSDAERRWAGDWVSTPLFGKFWSQIVRGVSRSAMSNAMEAKLTRSTTGQMQLSVDAAEEDGQYADLSGVQAKILLPDGTTRQANLIQTGPGKYEAPVNASAPGAYLAMVSLPAKNQSAGWTAATAVVDGSAEWDALQTDETTLKEIASRTGGRYIEPFDQNVDLFSHDELHPQSASMPITNQLLVLSMITLLLDVAVRRIAFDRKTFTHLAAAGSRFVQSFTQTTVPLTQNSVGALRSLRENPKPEIASTQKIEQLIVPATSKTGGSVSTTTPSSPAPSPATDAEPGGDSFSRLAAAKRRARENRNL